MTSLFPQNLSGGRKYNIRNEDRAIMGILGESVTNCISGFLYFKVGDILLISRWFWMIYNLLFVVECHSLCCHGNSIEFIGPFIQNDFPDFISWWIMWLLLPSTKQFLKSFTLQRAQTLRWLFSCFWNTNEFQMHLGLPTPSTVSRALSSTAFQNQA